MNATTVDGIQIRNLKDARHVQVDIIHNIHMYICSTSPNMMEVSSSSSRGFWILLLTFCFERHIN